MFTVKHERQLIVLLLVGAALSVFLFYLRGYKGSNYVISPFNPMAPTPTPTIDPATKEQTITLDSPDGKKTLTMKRKQTLPTMTYTFFISDKSTQGEQPLQIFTKSVDPSIVFSLPFNSWSSDYRYVFIKEQTKSQNNFYVFAANGSSTANSTEPPNITDLFMTKNPNDVMEDVTGWASPTLLIVNAKQKDQEVSYWYEVPSKSFIRLSNRFN